MFFSLNKAVCPTTPKPGISREGRLGREKSGRLWDRRKGDHTPRPPAWRFGFYGFSICLASPGNMSLCWSPLTHLRRGLRDAQCFLHGERKVGSCVVSLLPALCPAIRFFRVSFLLLDLSRSPFTEELVSHGNGACMPSFRFPEI